MTRTGQAAIDYARSRVGGTMPAAGYCLQFVRECFDIAAYYGSAIDAWNGCNNPHPGDRNPPAAVPVWFRSPSVYDHVAFYVGPNEVISTFNEDIRSFNGLAGIEANFSATYLGWGEDLNEVRVYTPGSGGGGGLPIGDDDDMAVSVFNGNRGEALLCGSRLVPIGDGSTASSIQASGIPRITVSDRDWDALQAAQSSPMMIVEPSRGYAILTGSRAIPIGEMTTVYALRSVGVQEVSVPASDFDRLVRGIEDGLPQPPTTTAAEADDHERK